MKNLKQFINWVFPYKCLICGCEVDQGFTFCPQCFSEITFVDHPICKVCGRMFESPHDSEICESCENSNPYFDLARAIFQYNDASKRIVMNIKKKSDNYTAKICAKMILTRYENIFGEVDYITPVPSHWTRLLVRGFNPANIVAYELSKISNVKYAHLLKRTRRTDYQRNKSVSERSANVSGAFSRNQRKTNDINCKNIILVDDVLTTGSTLNECAQTLKSLGANHVSCITIANTNRR